jgi:Protein of unknown function (DUF1616)
VSRRSADLWVTFSVAVLACAAAAVRTPVRIPVAVTAGLGLVLFAAPGYLLGQLLARSSRSALERLAVSAGLALCVPVIGGLLLYLARLPLNRASWLGLLAGVTVAADVLVFVQRRRHREALAPPGRTPGRARWRLQPGPAAAFALAIVIAAGAVTLAREGTSVQRYPGFTQLWLVPDTHTHDLSLGVANNEGATTRYQLVLLHNGLPFGEPRKLTLRNGQAWHLSLGHTTNFTAHLYRLPSFSHIYRQVSIGTGRSRG